MLISILNPMDLVIVDNKNVGVNDINKSGLHLNDWRSDRCINFLIMKKLKLNFNKNWRGNNSFLGKSYADKIFSKGHNSELPEIFSAIGNSPNYTSEFSSLNQQNKTQKRAVWKGRYPAGIYLLKINNRNTVQEICSKVNNKDTRTTPASFWYLYC